jgi:hypothetical protein
VGHRDAPGIALHARSSCMAWLLLAECRDVGIGAHADGDAEDDTGVQLQSNEQGSRAVLRVPNIMKHVCVASGIGDGKALGAGNISSNQQLSLGLARILAHGFIPPLAHAPRPRSRAARCGTGLVWLLPQTGLRLTGRSCPDMRCAPLLAMNQDRDSAARASLC